MTPQVSVVMPIYKPAFLAAAIDSILAQTMRDFELILINDGSPHAAVEDIARAYVARDPRCRYLKQENQGSSVARNTGAAAAVGRYLMWMDDDDISLPERMQQQVDFLQKHPDIAAVNCAHRGVDSEGDINQHYNRGRPSPRWKETIIQHTPPPLSDNQPVVIGPSSMVTRSAFVAINGMRRFFLVAEDLDFYHRLEEKYPVAFMPSVLYHYRSVNDPQRLTQRSNYFNYRYAAKISALYRRRGEDDPVGETTYLEDLINSFPLLPTTMRRNFIRQWYKASLKTMQPGTYTKYIKESTEYEQLFPAEKRLIQKYKLKITAKYILRKCRFWI